MYRAWKQGLPDLLQAPRNNFKHLSVYLTSPCNCRKQLLVILAMHEQILFSVRCTFVNWRNK